MSNNVNSNDEDEEVYSVYTEDELNFLKWAKEQKMVGDRVLGFRCWKGGVEHTRNAIALASSTTEGATATNLAAKAPEDFEKWRVKFWLERNPLDKGNAYAAWVEAMTHTLAACAKILYVPSAAYVTPKSMVGEWEDAKTEAVRKFAATATTPRYCEAFLKWRKNHWPDLTNVRLNEDETEVAYKAWLEATCDDKPEPKSSEELAYEAWLITAPTDGKPLTRSAWLAGMDYALIGYCYLLLLPGDILRADDEYFQYTATPFEWKKAPLALVGTTIKDSSPLIPRIWRRQRCPVEATL